MYKQTKIRPAQAINQYDLEGNFIKQWHSAYAIERDEGISATNIKASMKKTGKSHGYLWKYAEDDENAKSAY